MLIKIPLLVELLGVSRPTAYSILEYIKQHPDGLKELEKELEKVVFKKYVEYKKSINRAQPQGSDQENFLDGVENTDKTL